MEPLLGPGAPGLPGCEGGRCRGGDDPAALEECYWETLLLLRRILEDDAATCRALARRVAASRQRLDARRRRPADGRARHRPALRRRRPGRTPASIAPAPGSSIALREQLGKSARPPEPGLRRGHPDRRRRPARFHRDLGGRRRLPPGVLPPRHQPGQPHPVGGRASARTASPASCRACRPSGSTPGPAPPTGPSSPPWGTSPPASTPSATRCAPRWSRAPPGPFMLICGHAGMKTGEDGPTHADPQALQLLQENFVPGTAITLTPWEPAEVWPLTAAAWRARPALIAPFVTRPRGAGARPGGAWASRPRRRRLRGCTACWTRRRPGGRGRAAGVGRGLRLRPGGPAPPPGRRRRPGGPLRGERRAVRPPPRPSSGRPFTPRPWRGGRWASPASPCPRCIAGSAATWDGPTPCTPSPRGTTWGAAPARR